MEDFILDVDCEVYMPRIRGIKLEVDAVIKFKIDHNMKWPLTHIPEGVYEGKVVRVGGLHSPEVICAVASEFLISNTSTLRKETIELFEEEIISKIRR